MSDLARLSHLALVNRVSSELLSALSLDDRDLSEFLIDLAGSARDESDFRARMRDSGGDFEPRVIGRLWDIISKGLTQQRAMAADAERAKAPSTAASWDPADPRAEMAHKYKALALANTAPIPIAPEPRSPSSPSSPSRKRKRSPSPVRPSRPPPSPWTADGKPELYAVYPAVISNVKDNLGAFADLQGCPAGRCEGLIHISQLTSVGRLARAGDAVKRGQRVWVKVINRVGTKIGLSMREVDQASGEDLKPRSAAPPESAAPAPALGNEDLFSNPARPVVVGGGGRERGGVGVRGGSDDGSALSSRRPAAPAVVARALGVGSADGERRCEGVGHGRRSADVADVVVVAVVVRVSGLRRRGGDRHRAQRERARLPPRSDGPVSGAVAHQGGEEPRGLPAARGADAVRAVQGAARAARAAEGRRHGRHSRRPQPQLGGPHGQARRAPPGGGDPQHRPREGRGRAHVAQGDDGEERHVRPGDDAVHQGAARVAAHLQAARPAAGRHRRQPDPGRHR